MALRSMTGYGRGSAKKAGIVVTVELSSVNRKQCDVRISLPRSLASEERALLAGVRDTIDRGAVTGTVNVAYADREKGAHVALDQALVKDLVDAAKECGAQLGIDGGLSMDGLLRVPGVVVEQSAADETATVIPLCESAIKSTLRALVAMRREEGRALEEDLRSRLGMLEDFARALKKRAPAVKDHLAAALRSRLEDAGADTHELKDSIARELVVFAERCDVSEELTRLQSHFAQTKKLFKSTKAVGRTLDFVCQELFREVNTIGSKANDAEMAALVVAFKAELERFREQVQNVE